VIFIFTKNPKFTKKTKKPDGILPNQIGMSISFVLNSTNIPLQKNSRLKGKKGMKIDGKRTCVLPLHLLSFYAMMCASVSTFPQENVLAVIF